MDTLMMIVLTTMVVILGVAMGAAVQKKTYFLYPIDAFTLILFAFVGVQMLAAFISPLDFMFLGVDAYWYVPLVIGYIAGYIVSGRTRYIMIRRTGRSSPTGSCSSACCSTWSTRSSATPTSSPTGTT